MKKKRTILFLLAAVFSTASLFAEPPKREVRAVWLTTAWRLDWPSVTVPAATGNNEAARAAARTQQQNELLVILDRLEAANFNTIYFQARPMADALYRSNLPGTPWSQYISSVRGADPGWSPLGFLIEHAHARGMEVHAWLNPFRYASSAPTFGTLPTDYAITHPHWIMDYGPHPNGANHHRILNPGIPEVRTRIADIVEDIISNYNVDGIVFDDYFYKQRSASQLTQAQYDALDNAQFLAFNPSGLSLGDWRRENINMMIAEVQERINGIAPWIQFGVSPAGVAMGSNIAASIRNAHGVRVSYGSDWQYHGIFSDPVMWFRRGTVDYISPQIYWGHNHATNRYDNLSRWWSEVSNQFGRHFFSSNTATIGGFALANIPAEMVAQVQTNRNVDLNDAPGFVLFRANNSITAGDGGQHSLNIYNALRNNVFQNPALTANFGWKYAPMQGLVENLNVSGQTVTWTYTSTDARVGVRYAVYAIPNANRNDADAFTSSRFLQGMSYTTSFTLPAGISPATHAIAVSVFDRFGNLFPPRVFGEAEAALASVQLVFPAQNQMGVPIPTIFTWNSSGADFYVWEIAHDINFSNPIISRETTTPSFNSALQVNIRPNTPYYWRVRAIKANAPAAVSEVFTFNNPDFITTPTPEINVPNFFQIYSTSAGNFNLVINQPENTSVVAAVYTLTGRLLDRQTYSLNAGTTIIPLDLSGYARGIYLVQVSVGNMVQTQKIIK